MIKKMILCLLHPKAYNRGVHPVIVSQIRPAPYCGATFRQGRVKVRCAFALRYSGWQFATIYDILTHLCLVSHLSISHQWPNAVCTTSTVGEEAQHS